MAIADRAGLPIAVCIESARPHEVKLVGKTLCNMFIDKEPEKQIGDKAYDSDRLNKHLQNNWNIDLVAPNRSGCKKTQDGRKLRRYKRRWKVERLFAWIQNYRRTVTRY